MEKLKWIKICTDIFDDEKICLIETLPESDSILVCWFKLLFLAGKQNNSGVFMFNRIAYTDEMLATIFRRPIEIVSLSLETFVSFGMVEIVDNVYTLPNWGKHQSLDRIEKRNRYMKDYMREYRAKQKGIVRGESVCKVNGKVNGKVNVSVIDIEEDIEEEKKEKEIIKEKEFESVYSSLTDTQTQKAIKGDFVPPTLQEVTDYCVSRKNGIDPESFIDYYTSNGWTIGKNKPMRDWKAAIRTWERNKKKRNESQESQINLARKYRKTVVEWDGD